MGHFVLLLFHPIVHIAVLLAAPLVALARRRRPSSRWAVAALAYFALVFLSPVPVWMAGWLERRYLPVYPAQPAEAAVVLSGHTVYFHPEYGQYRMAAAADRVVEAIRLYRSGQVKLLVFSGLPSISVFGSLRDDETQSMKDFAVELGVPPDRILVEATSTNTRENAQHVAQLLPASARADFYLVTSALHMPRAMLAFHQAGLQPRPFPVHFRLPAGRPPRQYRWGLEAAGLFIDSLHEYAGLLAYRAGWK